MNIKNRQERINKIIKSIIDGLGLDSVASNLAKVMVFKDEIEDIVREDINFAIMKQGCKGRNHEYDKGYIDGLKQCEEKLAKIKKNKWLI